MYLFIVYKRGRKFYPFCCFSSHLNCYFYRCNMKLEKLFIIAVLLFIASCSRTSSIESKLFGKWEYAKIEKNDSSIVEISQNDEMELFIDHLFTYHIEKANKHESGSWKVFGDTLQFSYEPNGKLRNFIIQEVTETDLLFSEGDIKFYFTKED